MEKREKGAESVTMLDELQEYVSLRVASLKLSLVEYLSVVMSTSYAILLTIVCAGTALLFLLGAAAIGLGRLIGSLAGAMAIIGAVFAVLGAVVFSLRDRLILNRLIGMFSKMVFAPRSTEQNEDGK